MTIHILADIFTVAFLGFLLVCILVFTLFKIFSRDQAIFSDERIEGKLDNVIELLEILALDYLNLRSEELSKGLESPCDSEDKPDEA